MTVSRDLIEAAVQIGSNRRLVQGAGGNLSEKSSGTVAVKASGTRLIDAIDGDIFAVLDLDAARSAVLVREDLTDLVLNTDTARVLRPSIETAIHAILPHRFVFHVHAVATIAAGCSTHPEALAPLSDVGAAVVVVPYAKPGIALASTILAALSGREHATDDLVVILGNHGLITASQGVSRALELITEVEDALDQAWFVARERTESANVIQPPPPGWRELRHEPVSPDRATVMVGSALTPDCAVYLGPEPFSIDPTRIGTAVAFTQDHGCLVSNGLVGQDALEVAASFVDVAERLPPGGVRRLGPDQISDLLGWEAEKWRQAIQR